jgi:hypothetical protein
MVDSRIGAAGATVIIGLIVITPFCGLLFDCGCSWPWAGLESNCNFHKEGAAYHCPWCEYPVAGLESALLAVCSGVLAALLGLGRDGQVATRTLEGGGCVPDRRDPPRLADSHIHGLSHVFALLNRH